MGFNVTAVRGVSSSDGNIDSSGGDWNGTVVGQGSTLKLETQTTKPRKWRPTTNIKIS